MDRFKKALRVVVAYIPAAIALIALIVAYTK